jgi:undecaprenyl-diphosphatase
MTWIQSIVLALIQGITELFPVSSLGHTVILTSLLGWGQLESSANFLPFLVLFHLGTAGALLIYFWRDWWRIIRALVVTSLAGRVEADPFGRAAWLVVAGTIPAGLIGLFLQGILKQLFATPVVAAIFLVVNGVILLVGERARRNALVASPVKAMRTTAPGKAEPGSSLVLGAGDDPTSRPLASLSLREAALVGLAQALALIPGISRSGVTMVAALQVGMDHEDAAAYTFLLATPIIAAAGLLEVPQLFPSPASALMIAVGGGVVAGIAAYMSVRFLMRYFESGRLDPFGYYCIVAGLASLVLVGVGA